MNNTAEQQARDMLERMEVEDAKSLTAGDVLEIANVIARYKGNPELQATVCRAVFGLANGLTAPSTEKVEGA